MAIYFIFSLIQWLPYKWPYQLIFLAYRWILVLYFFSWLLVSGISAGTATYFIFLTNWIFITFNMYLIIAALAVTTKFISVHLFCPPAEEEFSHKYEVKTKPLSGCCGYSDNKINWYQMIQWFFSLFGIELSLLVFFLYFILLYDGRTINGINANTHLVNGIFALIDFWVSGIPINTLHVIYPMVFGAVYCVFTGIYFVASNELSVYPILDYGNNLGRAVGLSVAIVLIVFPIFHLIIFYLQHLAKVGIMYCIFGRHQLYSLDKEKYEKNPLEGSSDETQMAENSV